MYTVPYIPCWFEPYSSHNFLLILGSTNGDVDARDTNPVILVIDDASIDLILITLYEIVC